MKAEFPNFQNETKISESINDRKGNQKQNFEPWWKVSVCTQLIKVSKIILNIRLEL